MWIWIVININSWQYLKASEPKWVNSIRNIIEAGYKPEWTNSEVILIQLVYSDYIYATILYLQDLGWYIDFKLNNFIILIIIDK